MRNIPKTRSEFGSFCSRRVFPEDLWYNNDIFEKNKHPPSLREQTCLANGFHMDGSPESLTTRATKVSGIQLEMINWILKNGGLTLTKEPLYTNLSVMF
jgi:hypothetical protein